jgi:hypothetical protein
MYIETNIAYRLIKSEKRNTAQSVTMVWFQPREIRDELQYATGCLVHFFSTAFV